MLNGIDCSRWQGLMNWQKAKDAGVQFAIIRAGSIDNVSGVCYTDDQFRNNVANLALADIPYALYWFFRPNHSAVKQAEYFLNLAKDADLGDLAVDLWCDIEVEGRADVVHSFMDLLDRSGMMTGIYTNPNTALYLLTGDKAWMAEYPLWLADWTAPANPPKPWTEWAMWQYAVKPDGKEYGAQSASIDHNYAQDWMILPVVPPPAPDYEVRIKALETEVDILDAGYNDLDKFGRELACRIVALEARVAALEAPPAPPSGMYFKITAGTANARYVSRMNKAGRPIMEIMEPRTQWHAGDTIEFVPGIIVADGSIKYYQVAGYNPALYVRLADGVV